MLLGTPEGLRAPRRDGCAEEDPTGKIYTPDKSKDRMRERLQEGRVRGQLWTLRFLFPHSK